MGRRRLALPGQRAATDRDQPRSVGQRHQRCGSPTAPSGSPATPSSTSRRRTSERATFRRAGLTADELSPPWPRRAWSPPRSAGRREHRPASGNRGPRRSRLGRRARRRRRSRRSTRPACARLSRRRPRSRRSLSSACRTSPTLPERGAGRRCCRRWRRLRRAARTGSRWCRLPSSTRPASPRGAIGCARGSPRPRPPAGRRRVPAVAAGRGPGADADQTATPATDPVGHVCGVIARLDRERGSGWSPANALVSDAVDLASPLTDGLQAACRSRTASTWSASASAAGSRCGARAPSTRATAATSRIAGWCTASCGRSGGSPSRWSSTPTTSCLWFSVVRAISGVLMEAFRSGVAAGRDPGPGLPGALRRDHQPAGRDRRRPGRLRDRGRAGDADGVHHPAADARAPRACSRWSSNDLHPFHRGPAAGVPVPGLARPERRLPAVRRSPRSSR